METKNLIWVKWLIIVLIVVLIAWIYGLIRYGADDYISEAEAKKENLQKGIDTISHKQKHLENKAKDSAKSYVEKGNNIIKVIYYEKKPIVLPAADSVDRFVAAYSFTE